ncbi:MAG: hypothetical protein Q8R60_03400 [Mycobacteriales bacterium]|nr:hypothetical protein [Mycobacteriales bacterium]
MSADKSQAKVLPVEVLVEQGLELRYLADLDMSAADLSQHTGLPFHDVTDEMGRSAELLLELEGRVYALVARLDSHLPDQTRVRVSGQRSLTALVELLSALGLPEQVVSNVATERLVAHVA